MLASLALGVGACTTIFSWINGILLQPFPAVAGSGQYVVLASRTPSGALEPLSYAGYRDIRDAARVFDNLVAAGVTLSALNLGTGQQGDTPDRIFANFVSGHYFDALGIRTELGHSQHQALVDARPASRISCDSARSSTARAMTIAPTNVA
jgi:putative ABC transport system permease protein